MTDSRPSPPFRRGYVSIVGRPNVGKSTLLNKILGQKLSITSRKPQTTRHRILGIKTTASCQAIWLDTPGLDFQSKRTINRYMNRTATGTMTGVDLAVFVVEAKSWTQWDDQVRDRLANTDTPVILVVNKIDRISQKKQLLPLLDRANREGNYKSIVPLSAQRGDNVPLLETLVGENLPEGEALFPKDQLTDRSERFFASELIREKLTRNLGQELPYRLTVRIEQWSEQPELIRIDAVIWVERPGQKAIVIGKQGKMLKIAGSQARLEMEKLFGKKVFLQLWTKIRAGWSEDDAALRVVLE
uniref:GTPase Era n=1 Tax=Candidatus Kentrum sp. FM TaxID=2126340 RepID=A0A450T4K9_9GAMM|nr:MAG: GTP-binding protein Era [Candidatus Kentron sp. FM]VFJ68547.1 MAG: GTP-binding protein Era [Candidatus Kentron sp. FM]VFK17932.1 MAG: GTP-binding protein Era [Candidatus Kentron sp. FM]